MRDLIKSEDTINALWALYDHEIAARVFDLWKGSDAPDTLKNIRVEGNKIHELRGPGHVVVVPRAQFVRNTIAKVLNTIDAIPASATAAPDKMKDIHATIRDPKYRISKRAVAALDVVRAYQNAAPELRLLNGDGRNLKRLSGEHLEKVLDEPLNEFVRPFPPDQRPKTIK